MLTFILKFTDFYVLLKGQQVAKNIRDEERGGKADIRIIG